MKINKVTLNANALPEVVSQIPDPPQVLYVLGNLSPLLEKPRLAVVGARKVTPYGRGVTTDLIQTVARQGVVIVSGLALGVDSLAHLAALDAGGLTIAVLPCGLDKPYPASHRHLARRILEQGGALVSEYPEGTPPLHHHFIARNRLTSAFGNAVLITEAAQKSGTLHTAAFALDQGKTVMAVPGNITSGLSGGTNNLIKTGAVPVTSADDIFTALGLAAPGRQQELLAGSAEEAAILSLMHQGISEGSALLAGSKLTAATFNQTLTMLELTGKIRSFGASNWTIN